MRIKKVLSLLMVTVMVLTTMGSSYAAYYDELPSTTNVKISNTCWDDIPIVNPYTGRVEIENIIRFSVKWDNVAAYSFDNENWYGNGHKTARTFYIREDYYDKYRIPGVEVVLPKSVNVLFLYVKDYDGKIKVFTHRLTSGDLSYLYGYGRVPERIISVTDAIDALPTKANLKLSDEAKLLNVRRAFDALSIDQVWVYNAHKLYELETRLDELRSKEIDWGTIYKDLVMDRPGQLTEQYYDVPNRMYDNIYLTADKDEAAAKASIYKTKIGDKPKYTNAGITVDNIKDTTPNANNVFFLYDYSHKVTGRVPSDAMAKKVWGFFFPKESGKYQFKVTSDDGHNWIMYLDDGKLLEDNSFNILKESTTIATKFNLHNISEFTTSLFNLHANTPYPLFIEYFNHGGNAALKLEYRLVKDNGATGSWIEMKGDVFKPSSAYEFGFKAGNATELIRAIEDAQALIDIYSAPGKIGPNNGQVSQAMFDDLKNALEKAKIERDKAIENRLTQEQIDEATQALREAIGRFNIKPSDVNLSKLVQNGDKLHIEFDKDTTVKTYEIIISSDKTLSNDDKVYVLTNGKFVLGTQSEINVSEGELAGVLKKIEASRPDGKFSFDIALGALKENKSVTVFTRTAVDDNKGDAIASSINLLKVPTLFNYAVTDHKTTESNAEENVVFYTESADNEIGFEIDYYSPNSQEKSRAYVFGSNKNYVTLPLSKVDLSKISSAEVFRIQIENGIPKFENGHSMPMSNPKKVDIISVKDLTLTIDKGNYQLSWEPFDGATGYEVAMSYGNGYTTWLTNHATNSVVLPALQDSLPRYFKVRANTNNDQFLKSGYSNVVTVVTPKAPDIVNASKTPKDLEPPLRTNYVIKGDGTTKGYYLVTMPAAYLKLVGAKNVSQNSSGTFIADFPLADEKASIAFDEGSSIDYKKSDGDSTTEMVSYKVPYDKGDVGITIEGVKHDLKDANVRNVTIVKCVQTTEGELSGVSPTTTIAINVLKNQSEISKSVVIANSAFAEIKNNQIVSMVGAEFEITYQFHVNAEAVYSPNFVFDFIENKYFTYDYPTASAYMMEGDKKVALDFKLGTVKKATSNTTQATLYMEDDFNFNDKDVFVTLKVKPQIKAGGGIATLAKEQKLIADDSELWKISYIIADIKEGDKNIVMEGLKLISHTEFDYSPNRPGVKNVTTEPEAYELIFKNKNQVPGSH